MLFLVTYIFNFAVHVVNLKSLLKFFQMDKVLAILKKVFLNKYTISIVAMCLVVVIGIYATLNWLDSYTRHGEEIIVPDLKGQLADDACDMLAKKSLKCEVSDSLFARKMAPGSVVEQIPAAGEKVKENRTVYLIINARNPRQVPLPNLQDISVRQAEAMVKSVGLVVKEFEYVPSEYKDLVQDVKFNGRKIAAGTRLDEGSQVVLIVGKGMSDEESAVMSLRGLSLEKATDRAHDEFFNIGAVEYDGKFDESRKAEYFVYKQTPITGTKALQGQSINIYLTLDKEKLKEPEEIFIDSTLINSETTDDLWE